MNLGESGGELLPGTRLALARGRELYTAGRHFEAHEAWEEAWVAESGDARRLLHGLILVAAGLVKAFRDGRPAGAVKHLEAASERLASLPGAFAGVRLGEFRAELAGALKAARRWRDGEGALADLRAPNLRLQVPGPMPGP